MLKLLRIKAYIKTRIRIINCLLSFHIDHDELLEKYKAIWTKNEDLEKIECFTSLITRYGDRVYNNFCGLIVPKYGVECKYFIIICIDYLLVNKSKYCIFRQLCL